MKQGFKLIKVNYSKGFVFDSQATQDDFEEKVKQFKEENNRSTALLLLWGMFLAVVV